jgi:DNA/RNA endonuclease G (NUC1)
MYLSAKMPVALLSIAILAFAISAARLEASPLAACAAQFIDGDVANAREGSSIGTDEITYLCYQHDRVSFFATDFNAEADGPFWSAYRLDPANYRLDGCKTFTRAMANCYVSAETWTDFFACDRASDPFHTDRMLGAESLSPNAFQNTGHDRGHVAPRQAFSWHVCGTYQTFTMANMSPQRGYLNQDTWQALEQQVLTWAVDEGPLHVVSGAIYERFPHERFQVYQDGVFDPAWVYKPDQSFKSIVEQYAATGADAAAATGCGRSAGPIPTGWGNGRGRFRFRPATIMLFTGPPEAASRPGRSAF